MLTHINLLGSVVNGIEIFNVCPSLLIPSINRFWSTAIVASTWNLRCCRSLGFFPRNIFNFLLSIHMTCFDIFSVSCRNDGTVWSDVTVSLNCCLVELGRGKVAVIPYGYWLICQKATYRLTSRKWAWTQRVPLKINYFLSLGTSQWNITHNLRLLSVAKLVEKNADRKK